MKHLWILVCIMIVILYVLYIHRNILLISTSALKEKVIYTKSSRHTMNSCSYSIWFIVDSWNNNPKVLFTQTRSNEDIDLIVYFDDYINNLNIFLPELSNTYKKSKHCKILGVPLKEFDSTEKECMNACSQTLCNSYSYEAGNTEKVTTTTFSFDSINDTFEENVAHNFMKDVDKGKCSLFSSSPTMPNNCFLEQDKNDTAPYSVYDWSSFVYNIDINSYTLNKYSFPISIQKWTNLIITIDDYVMEVYINGKIQNVITLVEKKTNIPSKITIAPNGYGFNGKTRNFKYWDKCLTSKEINNLSKKVSN